jgi:P27 family predicted phage terminase small subunit
MRGRKPTPRVLKLLMNNPGRRPLNPQEPQPAVVPETQAPPDWLDASAQGEWRRLAPMLVRQGVLTEMDLDALTAYCVAWSTWKDATQKIRTFGMVIKTKTGYPITSPYIPIANKAMATMKALMTEFGMTPSSRNRVARVEPAVVNPLDRFTKTRA